MITIYLMTKTENRPSRYRNGWQQSRVKACWGPQIKSKLGPLIHLYHVTATLQNTAIVSERPQFFFEINESWYYMRNLAALHWEQKPEE